MTRHSLGLACGCIAVLGAALSGCAPTGPGPEPLVLAGISGPEPAGFADLTVVLAAVVDDRGRIDPTALATCLPRLDRQLAALARPWSDEARQSGSDVRLAWLYNARAAWCLRIIARQRRLTGVGQDEYALPGTIDRARLLDSSFPMDGGSTSLRQIDRELAAMDDFRIACAAPGATDLVGLLPGEAFAADTIRATVPGRFNDYVRDDRRIVIDHAARRLRVPPALHKARWAAVLRYNERFSTTDAMLITALGPYLDDRARRRLAAATGYRAEVRSGPAGILTRE